MLVLENVVIKGVASSVPEKIEKNRERFALDSDGLEKIIFSTGVSEKRVADENTETSDLCLYSARRLLEQINWQANELDALIFVTQTPDYQLPATSCILQQKLGMRNDTLCFDISLGCSGYVHGLQVASSLINNGMRKVLLLVGDTISKLVAKDDRSTGVLFGDAGTATCLEHCSRAKPSYYLSGTDGSGLNSIIVKPENAKPKSRGVISGDLVMIGADVFTFTIKRIPEIVKSALLASGKTVDDIDLFVFHQANEMMLKHLLKKCKIPNHKFLIEMERVGNTSGASIPVALSCKESKQGLSLEYSMLVGFGVGLSWGASVVDLSHAEIMPLLTFRNKNNA